MKTRVTMADVAREVGVSKGAISMALNNSKQVSEDLRVRVVAAAERMGYRRDPALSLIAASRWRKAQASPGSVLAYITMDHPLYAKKPRAEKPNPNANREYLAASARATELGYRLELIESRSFPSITRMSNVLRGRGIKGVIVGQIYDEAFVRQFDWKSFAAVAVHDGYVQLPVEQFTPGYSQALRVCWEKARERGKRRIGLVLFHEMREHYGIFILSAALMKLQSEIPAKDRIEPFFFDFAEAGALSKWALGKRLDMVIGFNDFHYWALLEQGVNIPAKMAFASLLRSGDPSLAGRIAGLGHDNSALGLYAMERLDSMLRRDELGLPSEPMVHRLLGAWTEGASFPDEG